MNVNELLARLPDSIVAIFERQDVIAGKLNEGLTLGEAYTSSETLAAMLRGMRRWELTTLKRIVVSFGAKPFEAEALERASRHDALSGAELRLGLFQLRRKGILFALRKSWGESLLLLPEDTFPIWQSLLCGDAGGQPAAEEIAAPGNEGFMPLVWNLLILLRFCNDADAALTSKGAMAKPQLAGLLKRLTITEDGLRPFELAYEHEAHYPAHVALLLETAVRLRLVRVDDKRLTVDGPAAAALFGKPKERVHQMLYGCWKEIYRPKALWLEHALIWLERQQAGAMPSVFALRNWLSAHGIVPPEEADEAEERLDDWLEAQAGLGWIELLAGLGGDTEIVVRASAGVPGSNGEKAQSDADNAKDANDANNAENSDDGAYAKRVEEAAADLRMLYVQPDFELLVTPAASYADIWQLTAFSETVRVDGNLGVMRMTKEKLLQAERLGTLPNMRQCLLFLQSRSYCGLPENVESTLLRWSDQQANAVEKKLQSVKTPKNNVSLVLSARPENFILESEAAYGGSFLFHREIPVFDVDAALPDPNDCVPDAGRIPAMWLKQYRSYHASTCKELLRQAIEWKTFVRMQVAGKERLIVPTAIVEEPGEWKLCGREAEHAVVLTPDEWHAVQIVLPGSSPS